MKAAATAPLRRARACRRHGRILVEVPLGEFAVYICASLYSLPLQLLLIELLCSLWFSNVRAMILLCLYPPCVRFLLLD